MCFVLNDSAVVGTLVLDNILRISQSINKRQHFRIFVQLLKHKKYFKEKESQSIEYY